MLPTHLDKAPLWGRTCPLEFTSSEFSTRIKIAQLNISLHPGNVFKMNVLCGMFQIHPSSHRCSLVGLRGAAFGWEALYTLGVLPAHCRASFKPAKSPSPRTHVFGLWEEAGVPGGNPRRHKNMQTPHSKGFKSVIKKYIYIKTGKLLLCFRFSTV